jgi:hypothetical protein
MFNGKIHYKWPFSINYQRIPWVSILQSSNNLDDLGYQDFGNQKIYVALSTHVDA